MFKIEYRVVLIILIRHKSTYQNYKNHPINIGSVLAVGICAGPHNRLLQRQHCSSGLRRIFARRRCCYAATAMLFGQKRVEIFLDFERLLIILRFFLLRAELFRPTAYCFLKVGNAPLSS